MYINMSGATLKRVITNLINFIHTAKWYARQFLQRDHINGSSYSSFATALKMSC